MAQKTLPVVLNTHEQQKLLSQPNPRYPTGLRNKCILTIMLNTGLRLSELTALEWRNVELTSGKIHVVQGKGSKDRILWIDITSIKLLKVWHKKQSELTESLSGKVFTTLKGMPLQNTYIQQMVNRYARKAHIQNKISPHTLRHTFATDLYRQTKNIRLVQKALGHADLSTTMIYTHLVDDELENALKNLRNN